MKQLNRPLKVDQVAAQMLLVFKQNPNTVMTRRDIEEMLTLGEFSESTRQRALWSLCGQDHNILWESDWPGGRPTTYRCTTSDPPNQSDHT